MSCSHWPNSKTVLPGSGFSGERQDCVFHCV
uniref:Uncharacterized protein n=1 Tax=Anguilla anguilla TaxID=7936 RepID=A0A0E9QZ24_ANGAN